MKLKTSLVSGVNHMSENGHIRLRRWYEPGDDREDFIDLTDYEVYYDSIKKQFKARFYCPCCDETVGVFCYPTNRMHVLLYELFEGVYCVDCFEEEHSEEHLDDDESEVMEGVMCSC